jgi:4-hydroxy-tetrahydrodipicolinate reductase
MGKAVEALVKDRPDMSLATRMDRPGADASFVAPREALGLCDVIIDFSTPEAAVALAGLAAAAGAPALVIGATGFTPDQEAAITEASGRIAIVKSGNFSLGVNLLAMLVEAAARKLGAADWDIEILESHHRRKVDAPSGTALLLGDAAAEGRGEERIAARLPVRSGLTGPRPTGGVGYAALRGGGVVGDHSVIFAAEDEIITLSHSARDRALFARGALAAAAWVVSARPGLYDMKDVLGV